MFQEHAAGIFGLVIFRESIDFNCSVDADSAGIISTAHGASPCISPFGIWYLLRIIQAPECLVIQSYAVVDPCSFRIVLVNYVRHVAQGLPMKSHGALVVTQLAAKGADEEV